MMLASYVVKCASSTIPNHLNGRTQHVLTPRPLFFSTLHKIQVEFADVTDEMKGFAAHSTLRIAKNEAKLYGIRIRMAKEKEEAK